MQPETCDQCGFATDRYTVEQAVTTVRSLGVRWRWAVAGVDPGIMNRRPAADTWSAAEYADHSADVVALHRMGLELMLTSDRPDFGPGIDAPPPGPPRTLDVDAVLDRLDAELASLHRLVADVDADGWNRTGVIGGEELVAHGMVRHVVHDVGHHLHDIGRGLHALGAGATTVTGTVAQLSASAGGVPKAAVDAVTVGWDGVEGDHQNDLLHHGRPWQALCLWSAEVIAALQDEGHPIGPGAAGENVTIAGIDWPALRPGVVLRIGDARVEVSSYSTPCAKNAQWFRDREFRRIDHDLHPGWSRVYASVLRPGPIATGDEVVVEP